MIKKYGNRNRKMDIRDYCLVSCKEYDGAKVRDCQKRTCELRKYRMGILSDGVQEDVEMAISVFNTKILDDKYRTSEKQ